MATILTISQDRQAKLSTFRVKINRAIAAGKFSQEVSAELTGISSDTELSEQAIAEITAMPKKAKGQGKPVGPSVDELQAELLEARLELSELKATLEGFDWSDEFQKGKINELTADLDQKTYMLAACEKECNDLQSAFDNLQAASNERLQYITRIEAMHKQRMAEVANILLARTQENESLQSELQLLRVEFLAKAELTAFLLAEEDKRKADTGRALLEAPNVRFLTALVPIIAQAVMYALLACKVFSIQATWYYILPLVVIGVLFEASGLMLSMSVPSASTVTIGGDKIKTRSIWLATFFLMQIAIDFAYADMLGSWSHAIGKTLISVSIPLTILAYNNLYLKD